MLRRNAFHDALTAWQDDAAGLQISNTSAVFPVMFQGGVMIWLPE